MAWFEKSPRGGPYLIGWREPDGTKRRKQFKRYEDARRFKSEVEGRIDRGEYVPASAGAVKLGEWVRSVIDGDPNLQRSTRAMYAHRYKHLEPIAEYKLADLTTARLRGFFAGLEAAGVGAPTRGTVRRILSKALTQAVADGMLARNPLKTISEPRSPRKPLLVLEPRDIEAAAQAAPPRWRAAILLAGYGGLRAGEIGGLRVDDVDFLRRKLTVNQAVSVDGHDRYLSEPKTVQSRRTISLPASVCEEIARHMGEYHPANGLIFTREDGGLVSHDDLGHAWATVKKRTGLKARFHDLRHTCASLMIRQGVHPKQIQAHMGHSSITVTMDVYGHLFPAMAEEAAARMDDVRREALQ